MLKTSRLAALLIAGAIVSAPAFADGKAFATVNGQVIPQAVYDAIIAEQKAKGVSETPEMRNAIKEQLIARELLVQEAKKKGFDKKSEITLQVDAAKQAHAHELILGLPRGYETEIGAFGTYLSHRLVADNSPHQSSGGHQ